MSENVPGRSVEVNGASPYYEDCATGPPLIHTKS